MAKRRIQGNRVYGDPPRPHYEPLKGGKRRRVAPKDPLFWFNADRGTFYSNRVYEMPSRDGIRRSHRLDVRNLIIHRPEEFRLRKNGEIYFHGHKVGWNILDNLNPPRKLRITPRRRKLVPLTIDELPIDYADLNYYESIVEKNPGYVLFAIYQFEDRLWAFYRNPKNGRFFVVVTRPAT